MVLNAIGQSLRLTELPIRQPGPTEVRLKVEACAVCRTDLHVVDGDLPEPKLPLVPGHEIVGIVEAVGSDVDPARIGRRVGVPWLGHTCGHCSYCANGAENLCDRPLFTGYTRDGGFATHAVADASYAFDLDPEADPVSLAPLLCAGLIGWRSLKRAGEGKRIGIYGFGAAAHIITQVALWEGRQVFAFTRAGDKTAQEFALSLGELGRELGGKGSRVARFGNHLCSGGRAGASRAAERSQGRPRRVRRHPHERHPKHALQAPLVGAGGRLDRQFDPSRRRGVLPYREAGGRPDAHADLCTCRCE
jgi:propanol-preferring alcohol dehydrogenase